MSVQILSQDVLQKNRARLNRLDDGRRIGDDEGACRFIAERGFVLLMPIEGVPLPSLARADAAVPWDGFACTDRVWNWKEILPGKKLCAYTKLVQGRGTFIAWRLYPSFLKVYGLDGDPDYEYENGRLKKAEVDLYHLVKEDGPIDSRRLWSKAKPIFGSKRTRFTAALERLQSRFYLTVAGGSLEGWTLHTWDLVERQAPPEVITALPTPAEARNNILRQTLQNCYAAPERQLRSILGWTPADLQHCLLTLKEEGTAVPVTMEGESIPWWRGN